MKRFLYLAAAVAMMMTACQKESFEVTAGDYVDISFNAEFPGASATKAISDGTTVNKLYYEVWTSKSSTDAEPTQKVYDSIDDNVTVNVENGKAEFSVRLIKNKPYTIYFWAQYEDGSTYTSASPYDVADLRNIRVSYDNALANDEKRDAFFKVLKSKKYETGTAETIYLTRPFSQVNFATSDLAKVVASNAFPVKSSLTFTNLAKNFDTFNEKGSEIEDNVTFGLAYIPGLDENTTCSVENIKDLTNVGENQASYDYLAMAYVLVPQIAANPGMTTAYATVEYTDASIVDDVVIKYENASIQQNYRTNIYGSLLTSTVDYQIEMDKDYVNDNNYHASVNAATVEEANKAFAAGETSVTVEEIAEDAIFVLPETVAEVTLNIPETDKTITITYADNDVAEKPAVFNFNISEGDITNVIFDLPETTVYANGIMVDAMASTANQTLVLTEGTEITGTLTVLKGNVLIENGAYVTKVTRDRNNEDEQTVIYYMEGISLPEIIGDVIVCKKVVLEADGKYFASFSDAIAQAADGSVIKVLHDIVLDADNKIVIPAEKTLTLDLNGCTVSYSSAVMNDSMITNNGTLTIKDDNNTGKIIFTYSGQADTSNKTGNYTITNNGSLIINGGHISINAEGTADETKFPHALYVIQNSGSMEMNAGHIYNGNNVAVRLWASSEDKASALILNGGEIKGLRAIWLQLPGSNTASAPLAEINVTGGTLTAWAGSDDDSQNKLAIYSYSFGNDMKNVLLNISGGTFNGDIALTGGSNKTNIETMNISGGTFNGLWGDVYSYGEITASKKTIQIKGGNFLSADSAPYWKPTSCITLGLDKIHAQFYADHVDVMTSEGLKAVADYVNGGNTMAGQTVSLKNDIDLKNEEWTPIGIGTNRFNGKIEGNNHSISNLQITERHGGYDQAALVGNVSGTVSFTNITFEKANIDCPDFTADFYGAALIGTMYGNVTIENVTVKDSYISGNNKVGGLIAHDGVCSSLNINNCNVSNVTFEAKNPEDGGSVGGLIGFFQGVPKGSHTAPYGSHSISNSIVKNCTFNVKNSTNNGKRANGQIVGGINSKEGQELYIQNCSVSSNTWNEEFYISNTIVEEDKRYVSPYGILLGGDRNDDPKGLIVINNDVYVPNATVLKAALEKGYRNIFLMSGEYKLSELQLASKEVTITGTDKSKCKINISKSVYAQNGKLTLKNLSTTVPTELVYDEFNYAFLHHFAEFNMIDCASDGRIRLNVTKANIENCDFTITQSNGFDGYAIYYYGNTGSCVTVNNSRFNTAGKAIVMYSESPIVYDLNVNECTFTSTNTATDKAAIQMHTEYGISGTLDITKSTATGFANINNGLWNELNNSNSTTTDKFEIVVDGNKVH